jgi:hypothetical protein
MQNKVSTNVINIFLESFENHLITMQEKENGKGIQRTFYPLDEETRLI